MIERKRPDGSTVDCTGKRIDQPAARPQSGLECSHCGGEPILPEETLPPGAAVEYDADGFPSYYETDERPCRDCGFPGAVSLDDETAWWRASEEPSARCTRAMCEDEECRRVTP